MNGPTDVGIKSVLLAYDFSEAFRKPLRHALAIASHFGAKFYLAYVVSSIGYTMAGPEASQLASTGSLRDAHKLEIDLLHSGSLHGLEHEFLVTDGNIADAIERIIRQKQVDAVVVGTHGRGDLGKLVLGSVAEQIFRRADCPVLTVGLNAPEDSLIDKNAGGRTFLLATDFGPGSLRTLSYAVAFARRLGAQLVVLHVLPAAPLSVGFHWSTTGDLIEMRRRAQEDSEKQFHELLLPKVPPEVNVEFVVRFGIPSDQILEVCHALNANLLMVGLHRAEHVGNASHSPWDVAYKLVSTASCPVLTLKGA